MYPGTKRPSRACVLRHARRGGKRVVECPLLEKSVRIRVMIICEPAATIALQASVLSIEWGEQRRRTCPPEICDLASRQENNGPKGGDMQRSGSDRDR